MQHKPKHSQRHTAIHRNPVDEKDAGSTSHRWLLPVLLVAQLMVILDITAVNIALPHIATDLHMSGSTISWTITSYSLIFGSLLLFGGVLTQFTDWRTIFYVNLPVAAALLIAALKVVPADTHKPRWRGLDLPGAALATTSLAAIVYGITQAHAAGWTSIQTHICGIGGLAGLAAFAIYELHIQAPLLRVERIADRAIGGGLVLMLATAGTIFGLFLLCSLYLQHVLGWGPLTTGLAFVPLALSAGIGSHAAGHVI